MLKAIVACARQGHRTLRYPETVPALPDRFRGRPVADPSRCPEGCRDCADACPTRAITAVPGSVRIDLGRCLFCTDCVEACPQGAIRYSHEFRLAVRGREDLLVEWRAGEPASAHAPVLAAALERETRRLFGRSLRLRQVSAGGCNACEADTNVLSTIVFDIARFGIQFVASPRHADGVLITGPVSGNMRLALEKTWAAVPAPKIAIAVGACAIAGGPYIDHPEVANGACESVPVDLYVPGCPPHPLTILDGLLRLLGRIRA